MNVPQKPGMTKTSNMPRPCVVCRSTVITSGMLPSPEVPPSDGTMNGNMPTAILYGIRSHALPGTKFVQEL